MDMIKLYWRDDDTVLGEVDSETFEIVKMDLKNGKKTLEVARELISSGLKSAQAVRIALCAKKQLAQEALLN